MLFKHHFPTLGYIMPNTLSQEAHEIIKCLMAMILYMESYDRLQRIIIKNA